MFPHVQTLTGEKRDLFGFFMLRILFEDRELWLLLKLHLSFLLSEKGHSVFKVAVLMFFACSFIETQTEFYQKKTTLCGNIHSPHRTYGSYRCRL